MKRPIAFFAGTGRSVPTNVMTNHDFAGIGIDTTHEWIVERSGIHQRHFGPTNSLRHVVHHYGTALNKGPQG